MNKIPLNNIVGRTEEEAKALREAARAYYDFDGNCKQITPPAIAVLEAAWAYGHAWQKATDEFVCAMATALGPMNAEPVVIVHAIENCKLVAEIADAWVEPRWR